MKFTADYIQRVALRILSLDMFQISFTDSTFWRKVLSKQFLSISVPYVPWYCILLSVDLQKVLKIQWILLLILQKSDAGTLYSMYFFKNVSPALYTFGTFSKKVWPAISSFGTFPKNIASSLYPCYFSKKKVSPVLYTFGAFLKNIADTLRFRHFCKNIADTLYFWYFLQKVYILCTCIGVTSEVPASL